MPKVTVIVPVYNVEKYLRDCLNSLINQSLKDIEILCIDDGSTDNSGNICEEYAKNDARVKVIHKPNSGYGHSINLGIQNSNGKYLAILESDDFADRKMYENLWDLAEKYEADLVKCAWYEYFTDTKTSVNTGSLPVKYANKVITYRDFHDILKNKTTIWAGIYKKDFLISNNLKCLETMGASFQDTSFNFQALIFANRIVLTEKPYVYYRQDNINSSVKSKGKIFNICREYDVINNVLDSHPQIKEEINYRKLINEYNHYTWNLLRIAEEYRPEFIDKFAERFKVYYDRHEINEKFFRKINKKEFNILMSDKDKFLEIIKKKAKKKIYRQNRKKLFSLKISSSRISLVMFGKQILQYANSLF